MFILMQDGKGLFIFSSGALVIKKMYATTNYAIVHSESDLTLGVYDSEESCKAILLDIIDNTKFIMPDYDEMVRGVFQ